MDRVWLLTWTTYGQWFPGDSRGFVGDVRTSDWEKIINNLPGEPYDTDLPALLRYCREAMTGPPILLGTLHAQALLEQFHETSEFRGWSLQAAAVMANHVHAIVGVVGDPEPASMLQSLKAYGSRRLNRLFGKPVNGTWWTESGSKRKLATRRAIENGITYVEEQEHPLVVWSIRRTQPVIPAPGD